MLSTHHHALLLDGVPLERVETFKYLGILLSSDLSWSAHVNSICSKARKLIGLLYRRFYTDMASDKLLELYKILIRPHLEYAAPIWAPYLTRDTSNLEHVQKFGLRMCMKNWDAAYHDLLDMTQMPTLENRRLYLKLCTLYKIIHGSFYFPSHVIVPQPSRRIHAVPLLHQPFAHTTSFQSSFFPSTISVWNNLPVDALTAPSTYSFKNHIAPLFV